MSNEAAPASSLTDKEREAIAQMPYEEARDKLIQAVQALEAGGLNLDQSMRQWGDRRGVGQARAEPAWRGPSQARRRAGRAGHRGQHRRHARQSGLSIRRGTAAPLTYGRSTGTSVKRLEPEQSGPITRHVESILCVQW